MTHHIIKSNTYEKLYGAPSLEEDPEGWKEWVSQANIQGYPPTPREHHEDDCPGCK